MSCSVEVSAVAVSAAVPVVSGPIVSAPAEGNQMNVPAFIAMLSAATEEQLADILAIFHRGNDLWTRRTKGSAEQEVAVVAPIAEEKPVKPSASKKEKVVKEKPAKVEKPKKEKVDSVTHAKRVTGPKKEKAAVALPEATEGAPDASEYRIPEADIDSSVCVARVIAGEDKRWKPAVFREGQCGAKVADGCDLCTKCSKRQDKYAEAPKAGPWTGRVTEEPLDWMHMLGTSWATDKNPKFIGDAPEAEAAAPASDKAAAKAASAVAKAAAKAQKEAEKAAAAAEKAAEKAAAKEAAKASKPAKKTTKKAAAPASEVKVAAEVTEPTEVEGELMCIDGEMYMIKKGNVYEYDEIAETVGDFVGRLTADKTINTEAEEEAAEESDSE